MAVCLLAGLLACGEDMMVPKQKDFEMFRLWSLCTDFGARRLIRDVGGCRMRAISRITLKQDITQYSIYTLQSCQ